MLRHALESQGYDVIEARDQAEAVEQLREVLASAEWRRPEFNRQQAVT